MTERTINYKGRLLSYSEIADDIILEYGCSKGELLAELLYLGTGKVLCEAELSIVRDCYMVRVCSIKNLMSYYE